MKESLRKLKNTIKRKLDEWEKEIDEGVQFEDCLSCSRKEESSLNILRDKIHKNAVDKGFYKCGDCDGKGNVHGIDAIKYNACPSCDGKGKLKKNFGELLMLVVSELAEAVEADRKGRHANINAYEAGLKIDDRAFDRSLFKTHIKDTVEDEIVDSISRLFDACGYYGIDIQWHLDEKAKYNSTREAKHGKRY